MNVRSELQARFESVIDLGLDGGIRGEAGIAQPVVAHHAVFVRIGDGTAFQLPHVLEGSLDAVGHGGEQAFIEGHAADVDGETEVRIADEVLLKTVPVVHASSD